MAARWAARCPREGRRFFSTPTVSRLTSDELILMRNELFNREKERQLSLYPRIEKIEVKYTGKSHPGTVFIMNKALSTPYNCAMHLSEWHCKKSVLALVDGEVWDMYKPLTKSCEIQFLTFKDEDPEEVNKAYWRSCAMIMACVLKRAFKDEYSVNLIKSPEVPVISGAFCYDVILDNRLNDWKPTNDSFRSLTRDATKLIHKDLPFETLHVEAKVAHEMFQHNRYKMEMIERKASQNAEGIVTLHRVVKIFLTGKLLPCSGGDENGSWDTVQDIKVLRLEAGSLCCISVIEKNFRLA
ncbi:large ribosomal subunit protein mL39 isoform X5 [Athene noctua]|uniref:large ribosomal subunit protein mL39 isoform X5 n=1 Tax=Athene noctua TaxID=126797 RepID=UPI003EC12484